MEYHAPKHGTWRYPGMGDLTKEGNGKNQEVNFRAKICVIDKPRT